jgi:pheromone a factor receptor
MPLHFHRYSADVQQFNMDGGSYDVGSYLTVPLYNSSYKIKDDHFLKTLIDDPYTEIASLQVYFLEILTAFAIILVVPAFFWHIRNRNLPASCLVFWTLWLNLMNLVNALIWPTDNLTTWFWGQGLCDIMIKMDIGSSLGIIGAVVCILRSLAGALNTERIRLVPRRAEAIRQRIIESLFCIGLPILAALLHVFVQSRRYYIYAISGCMYTVGETWLDVLFLWMWPPFLAFVAAYYAGLVLVRVIKYRREFSSVLSASSSGMNKSRFTRLFTISLVLLFVYLPVEIYVFVWNITLTPLGPYSWADIHSASTWDYILFFPAYGQVFFDRWIYASLGYALFFTLGLGADATQFWRSLLLGLGFGGIFPSLTKTAADNTTQARSSTSGRNSTHWAWLAKFGSKTRLLGSTRSSKASERTTSNVEKGTSLPIASDSPVRTHTHGDGLALAPISELAAEAGNERGNERNDDDRRFAALEEGLGTGGDGMHETGRERMLGGVRAWEFRRAEQVGEGEAESDGQVGLVVKKEDGKVGEAA